MAQDIQAFRVGGHHAVLDAVVDHLDEVARATRAAVQIAVFGGAADLLPAGRARSLIDTWGQRGEDRVEALDDGIFAADHQAVAALRSPDPAAGSDVHIVDAFRFQIGGAANVIVVVGVAAVDDHVVAFEERDEGLQRWIDRSRRHHHPDGARLFQFLREIFERRRPDRALFGERLHGFRLKVVNDALVAGPLKAPHHVGSHPCPVRSCPVPCEFLSIHFAYSSDGPMTCRIRGVHVGFPTP